MKKHADTSEVTVCGCGSAFRGSRPETRAEGRTVVTANKLGKVKVRVRKQKRMVKEPFIEIFDWGD